MAKKMRKKAVKKKAKKDTARIYIIKNYMEDMVKRNMESQFF